MRTDQTYGNLNITNIFQIYIIKCAYNYSKLEQVKKKIKPSSYVMLRTKFLLLKKSYNSDSQGKKITT